MATQPTDWIEWSGGECPVADDTIVQTKYRNGRMGHAKRADDPVICWGDAPQNDSWDLIAYRVVQS